MGQTKKHRLVLVESDDSLQQVLIQFFTQSSSVELCGIVKDGAQVLEQIARLQPDVVWLDLSLPTMNAYAIMEQLPRVGGRLCPPVLVSSLFPQNERIAWEMGASNFILKPSFHLPVVEKMICLAATAEYGGDRMDIHNRVVSLLNQMHMPTHRAGYKYIVRAAELMYTRPRENLLNKEINLIIGEECGTNCEAVETAMRNIIKETDVSLLHIPGTPTCRKFLTKLLEYLELN